MMESYKYPEVVFKGRRERPKGIMIMVHGRGATASSILALSEEFENEDFSYNAPQAPENTWYPNSFLAPIEQNEPGISTGIGIIHGLVQGFLNQGFDKNKIIILGFSQGACLTLEFAARYPARYGGIIGFSGGLIGPENTVRNYEGSFENSPIFLGCSDVDPHVPLWRVKETTQVLSQIGGKVTERIYPGMPHTVNQDEINFVKNLMKEVAEAG